MDEPKEAWVIEQGDGSRWVIADVFANKSIARDYATQAAENGKGIIEYRVRRYVPAEE